MPARRGERRPQPAADIVSPITDRPLPDKATAADARAEGRFGHDKPTVDNSIVLLIDHQIGLMVSTRDTSTVVELRSNVLGLARTAKALQLPTLISSSNAQWQNGDTIPELEELFPDTAIIRRTGIVNAYEDPAFRAAFDAMVEQTGRRQVTRRKARHLVAFQGRRCPPRRILPARPRPPAQASAEARVFDGRDGQAARAGWIRHQTPQNRRTTCLS